MYRGKVRMKFSIITVCYNSADTIEKTIKSVLCQKAVEIEYIIIDGDSSDGTLEIIKKYSKNNNIIKWISEKDFGIYDAMNKGIKFATGDIIGILNSDDYFIIDMALKQIENYFTSDENLDSVYANINYIENKIPYKVTRKWISGERKAFNTGWHPAHPAFYVKRSVYEKYGLFDLKYKLAADFELMLRFMDKYNISSKYLPVALINMRLGGETNKSIKNVLRQNIECITAFKKNGVSINCLTYPIRRLFPKIMNLIRIKG